VTEEDLHLQNKIDQLSLDWNNFKSTTTTREEFTEEDPLWARQPEEYVPSRPEV